MIPKIISGICHKEISRRNETISTAAKFEGKALLSMIIIALIAITSSVTAAVPVNLVSIGNYAIETAATIRVPVYLNNSEDIASVGIAMTFNPAVVNMTSLDPEDVGDFTQFYGPDNRFTTDGVITINTFKNGSGSSGDLVIGYVRLHAVGSAGSSSPLNISVIAMGNGEAKDVDSYSAANGSFMIIADNIPPEVTNLSVNQSDIPDDTDNDPLWGETMGLNVTVADDSSGISSVTIDLSEIGGPPNKPMTSIGGNIYSTTTNASAGTPPKTYNLTVNATDMNGNSNNSVKIQLKVMKNGDTTGNGVVNIGDALRLANNVSHPGNSAYVLSSIYVADVTGNGVINIGDALRLANNVSHPGNLLYILK